MGLDAYVACSCFRDGKSSKPPFADRLVLDEHGEPSFDPSGHVSRAKLLELHEWSRSACPHRHMWHASERIGPWGAVGIFFDMLDLIDADFMDLKHDLRETTRVPTDAAKRLLADLERFNGLGRLGEMAALVDAETGDAVASYIGRGSVLFMMRGPIQYALDMNGFVVRSRAAADGPDTELFRSRHFRQELIAEVGASSQRSVGLIGRWCKIASGLAGRRLGPSVDDIPKVEFVDRETDSRFRGHMAIRIETENSSTRSHGKIQPPPIRHPRELRVDIRTAVPQDFSYITQCLVRLCRASIETGNPICWT